MKLFGLSIYTALGIFMLVAGVVSDTVSELICGIIVTIIGIYLLNKHEKNQEVK